MRIAVIAPIRQKIPKAPQHARVNLPAQNFCVPDWKEKLDVILMQKNKVTPTIFRYW